MSKTVFICTLPTEIKFRIFKAVKYSLFRNFGTVDMSIIRIAMDGRICDLEEMGVEI